MKPILFLVSLFLLGCGSSSKSISVESKTQSYLEVKQHIEKVMADQTLAWNNHDLEGFMQGYWKNDSLKFYGSRGLTYGWNNTLANYKKSYPTQNESGTLKFVINDISKIENNSYWVMGEYHLIRPIGNADGVFTIIFKLIDGEWKIIADMSC